MPMEQDCPTESAVDDYDDINDVENDKQKTFRMASDLAQQFEQMLISSGMCDQDHNTELQQISKKLKTCKTSARVMKLFMGKSNRFGAAINTLSVNRSKRVFVGIGGSKALAAGRPSNEVVAKRKRAKKQPHCLAAAINNNRPNAKGH